MIKSLSLLAATAGLAIATGAHAQDTDHSNDFNGLYVSGYGGYSTLDNNNGETVSFDTNRDGVYRDPVITAAGANAFSPGFCSGTATGNQNIDCNNKRDGAAYGGRIGYDRRYGHIVIGALVEGGREEGRQNVTAFSTTPAFYEFSRQQKFNIGLRARVGYTPNGGVLFYATGGGEYAQFRNDFRTSNTANSFTSNGDTDAWGFTYGGGAEVMVTRKISLGVEYLRSQLYDRSAYVAIGAGTAPATNPFLRNGGGTNIRPSYETQYNNSFRATVSYHF